MWCEDKYAEFQFRTWNGIMPRQKMPKRKEREVNSFKLQSLYWATEGEGCIVSVGRPNMIYMTLDNTKIKHPSFLRPSNFIVSIFFFHFFCFGLKATYDCLPETFRWPLTLRVLSDNHRSVPDTCLWHPKHHRLISFMGYQTARMLLKETVRVHLRQTVCLLMATV